MEKGTETQDPSIASLALCLGRHHVADRSLLGDVVATIRISADPTISHGFTSTSKVSCRSHVSFLALKPSKHMSDGIGNLVLISRLHVAAGQIALAVVVAQSASVFLGGPG